ncbi:hypothetical protein [Deinococcus sp. UR1]|uniref:hypothetical protein n=1 Tax=Deinococcus sp. UR1 TaxID=1704277 RepID=UPI000C17AC40|nr:hypothetical protein [Deinococcus sp. UR1]PIG99738.1 hypothetical protein AMD26_002240 [Deinococcus sp. UR1]
MFAQGGVHAFDHVLHDFGWGVPHAELFSQFRVVRGEERFVEVLHGVALEFLREGGHVHAGQGGGGPVEQVREVQAVLRGGVGEFPEQALHDGQVQFPRGGPPVERHGGLLGGVQHPRAEQAVPEGLDEGGAEEAFALFVLELQVKRFAQGAFQRGEGFQWGVAQAVFGFAGVAGEEPRDALGGAQGRAGLEGAGQEFREGRGVCRLGVRVAQQRPERGGVRGEFQVFQQFRLAVLTGVQREGAQVRDEHQAVQVEVPGNLLAGGDVRDLLGGGFDFQRAPAGQLAAQDVLFLPALKLPCIEESAVGDSGAQVAQVVHRMHAGFQGGANAAQQAEQRRVVTGLGDARAGGVHGPDLCEVRLDGGFGVGRAGGHAVTVSTDRAPGVPGCAPATDNA